MQGRGSLTAASLVECSLVGCAPPDARDEVPYEAPVVEPLDVTIDAIDVVHGGLRVRATMVDGAADVSMRLAGDCAHRPVGGGMATRWAIVWSLSTPEVADAISCGLEVHAFGRDGARSVDKVATLGVGVEVSAEPREDDENGPQLQELGTSSLGVDLAFRSAGRGARLTTVDSILVSPLPEDDDETDDDTARFTVPLSDFARSVLGGRPLYVAGWAFATSVSVGGTSLSVEEPGPQDSEESADEG